MSLAHAFLGLILGCSLCLVFISLGAMSFISITLIQGAMAVCLALWFCLRLVKRDVARLNFLSMWFFGFLVWLAIQALGQSFGVPQFGTPAPWATRISLYTMFLTGFGFYLTVSDILIGRRSLIFFLHFLVIASSVLALYFVTLFFIIPRLVDNFTGPFPLIGLLKDVSPISLQPNNLVDLFFPGAFFSLSLVFYWKTRDVEHGNPQKVYGFMLLNLCFACVLIAAVLFTKSRAGILAFLAALTFYFIFFTLAHRRRGMALRSFALVFTVALIFLLTLGLKDVIRELRTLSDTYAEETQLRGVRALTIGASWQLVKHYGMMGVGLGNFQMGWLLNHHAPFSHFPQRSYNDFLWLWAETGILGIIFFAGGIFIFVFRCVITALKTESYSAAYFLIASASSLVAFAIHALVDPTFYVPPILWLFSVVCGVGAGVHHQLGSKEKSGVWMILGLPKMIAALFIFTAALSMGWFSVNKIRAYLLVQNSKNESKLLKAEKLDFFNSTYPAALAIGYGQDYQKNPSRENLEKFLRATDRAIELEPFQLTFYMHRAALLLKTGNESAVRETFKKMNERLPRFYLAELAASAFYMNASTESENPDQAIRLEGLAIRHYLAALELYPGLVKETTLYPFASQEAVARFQTLASSKQI